MALTHKNRLKTAVSAVASSGLGAFTIGAAASGYRTFGASDDGNTFDVLILEGTDWEVRTDCAYTHSSTSLARGTLEDSSTGSAIAFTAAATIVETLTAGRANTLVRGAAGSNTQVQYNSSGAFAGSSALTFDGSSLTVAQTTAATSGANQNSPNLKVSGTVWNGSASVADTWTIYNIVSTGSNPRSWLTFTPTASTGLNDIRTVQFYSGYAKSSVTGLNDILSLSSNDSPTSALQFVMQMSPSGKLFAMQSVEQGVGFKNLAIQPSGGIALFGTITANATGAVAQFNGAISIGTGGVLASAASNTLSQRNSTNAQTAQLFGTYTDASNGRWIETTMSTSGAGSIKPTGNGTGASGNTLMVVSGSVTVANLPASPGEGARHKVSDSTTTTFLAAVTGGGANHVPVVYLNGTWCVG